MSRFLSILSKNFKLLFRNKETVYTIVFGPLLIILLVGFAFMGGNDYRMHVGIAGAHYSQETGSWRNDNENDLMAQASRTAQLLESKGYVVLPYPDEASCAQGVKDADIHACIAFEPGTVSMYLDESRMNLVYKISDDLSSVIDVQASALRQSLANDAIARITVARKNIDADINRSAHIQQQLALIQNNLSLARDALASISNDPVNVSLQGLSGHQLGLAQKVGIAVNMSVKALDESGTMIQELADTCDTCSNTTLARAKEIADELDGIKVNLTLLYEQDTKNQLQAARFILDDAVHDINNLTMRFANESKARATITKSANASAVMADNTLREMGVLEKDLRSTRNVLEGTRANATTIAAPFTVDVHSVAATKEKVAFTYPYLFVLVMMFMGLLLASTLVVADKMSRASFRNFTTPVSDSYHIFGSFITAFLILAVEAAIILIASAIFVAQPLLLDTPSTLLIVAITIVVFSFIGMIIGYLARTQEAAMIASISIGSILLFVSNVIAPIEGMMRTVQVLASVNPYLVLSELLKRSMLFGISVEQTLSELLVVFVLIVVLFVITTTMRARARRKYFRQDGGIVGTGLLGTHVPSPLALAGRNVHDLVELLDVLDHMTRAEFEAVVKADMNIINVWVEKELREKRLAKKLRTTSKERMMIMIDAHLKKHGKELKK